MSNKTKDFIKKAGIRTLRTFLGVFLGYASAATMLTDFNWATMLSTALMSSITTFAMAILTGLPEVDKEEK